MDLCFTGYTIDDYTKTKYLNIRCNKDDTGAYLQYKLYINLFQVFYNCNSWPFCNAHSCPCSKTISSNMDELPLHMVKSWFPTDEDYNIKWLPMNINIICSNSLYLCTDETVNESHLDKTGSIEFQISIDHSKYKNVYIELGWNKKWTKIKKLKTARNNSDPVEQCIKIKEYISTFCEQLYKKYITIHAINEQQTNKQQNDLETEEPFNCDLEPLHQNFHEKDHLVTLNRSTIFQPELNANNIFGKESHKLLNNSTFQKDIRNSSDSYSPMLIEFNGSIYSVNDIDPNNLSNVNNSESNPIPHENSFHKGLEEALNKNHLYLTIWNLDRVSMWKFDITPRNDLFKRDCIEAHIVAKMMQIESTRNVRRKIDEQGNYISNNQIVLPTEIVKIIFEFFLNIKWYKYHKLLYVRTFTPFEYWNGKD